MCLLVPHHRSGLCMMFVKCVSLYIWMSDSSFWFMSLVICVYIQKRCDITYNLNIVLYFSTSTYIARSPGSHIYSTCIECIYVVCFSTISVKTYFFNWLSWSVYFTLCGPFAITLFYFDCCIFSKSKVCCI